MLSRDTSLVSEATRSQQQQLRARSAPLPSKLNTEFDSDLSSQFIIIIVCAGLIPQLLYLNQRPMKAIATRDGLADPSARKGLHHHSTRTGSSTRVGHRSGSSRRKAASGASTSVHHRSVSRPKTSATGTHRTRGASGTDGVKSSSRHHHRH